MLVVANVHFLQSVHVKHNNWLVAIFSILFLFFIASYAHFITVAVTSSTYTCCLTGIALWIFMFMLTIFYFTFKECSYFLGSIMVF